MRKTENNSAGSGGMPENRAQDEAGKLLRIYLPVCIVLAALALRMIYGHDLPLNMDERRHLEFAGTISLDPDHFNMPIGSLLTNHPVLSAYIAALAGWMGHNSVNFIRLVFIAISIIGLAGLFFLARVLFGYRAANIALLLASLDHYLLSNAVVILEPVYLCLVPWVILTAYKAVEMEQDRQWLILGLLFGIGYQCSEIFLLLSMGTCLYVLSSRRIGAILKKPGVYLAGLTFFIIILPNIIWNINSHGANFIRHAERLSSSGPVPRVLLLYFGDLLISLKNSSWWVMGMGNETYVPWNIPCHWTAGFLYLGSLCYSLRFFKEKRCAILHYYVWTIFLVVSFLNANGPWNEFGWAGMTVMPVILLSAYVMDNVLSFRPGRIASVLAGFVLAVYAAVFLAGPKYGYASPAWEKNFVGKMVCSYAFPDTITREEAKKLADEAAAAHPDSAIAHYYKGAFADSRKERKVSLKNVLKLEPYNPLAIRDIAEEFISQGNTLQAKKLLKKTIKKGNDFVSVRKFLGHAEYNLGNFREAGRQIEKGLRIKPDEYNLYRLLYRIRKREGKFKEAFKAFDRYAFATGQPHLEYLVLSGEYARRSDTGRTAKLCRRAIEIKPDFAEAHYNLGIILSKEKRYEEAVSCFSSALKLKPDDAKAHRNMGYALQQLGKLEEAEKHFKSALKLKPDYAEARKNLDACLELMKKPEAIPGDA